MIPSEEKLPALEKWAMETAAQLAPELTGVDRLRVALGLLQARALECRHVGGTLLVQSSQSPASRALALHLDDRSAKLEEFATKLAEKYFLEQSKVVLQ
jgi:hypothetical protein